jgi:hypothetical protein
LVPGGFFGFCSDNNAVGGTQVRGNTAQSGTTGDEEKYVHSLPRQDSNPKPSRLQNRAHKGRLQFGRLFSSFGSNKMAASTLFTAAILLDLGALKFRLTDEEISSNFVT